MPAPEPILAVDDSAPIREMIGSVLKPHGHHVITATNGQEALLRLEALHEPYIILLDIVMPVLDGIAVVHEIAHNPALREVGHKVILMSSTVRLSALDIPITAGQLVKPFSRQQLLDAIAATRQTTP